MKNKHQTYRNKVENWLPGPGGGGNRERWVKGYKLSALKVKVKRYGDLMCNMMTTANSLRE